MVLLTWFQRLLIGGRIYSLPCIGLLGVPLLVYLHNGDVVETNIFCSQVLTHGLISLTINENFVPWGWDVTKDSNRLAFIRECQNLSPYVFVKYRLLATLLIGYIFISPSPSLSPRLFSFPSCLNFCCCCGLGNCIAFYPPGIPRSRPYCAYKVYRALSAASQVRLFLLSMAFSFSSYYLFSVSASPASCFLTPFFVHWITQPLCGPVLSVPLFAVYVTLLGYHSVDQLLDKIMSDLLVKCNPILEAERAKEVGIALCVSLPFSTPQLMLLLQLEAMQRQQLKLEQDQALQASLATDRAKEQRRREEDERTRIEQQERNQIERDQQRQAELDTRMRQQRVSEEPPSNYAGPMATIQFRLPTGARLSRRFYLSDRVQDVVDFVALQDFKPPTYILVSICPSSGLAQEMGC